MATYAFSDLHGRYDLFEQIINFLKPEDKVYCLGDCGDRGPDGWELIRAVYTHPQITYLKGNHEDMLVKAANTYLKYGYMDYDYYLLCQNGGEKTFSNWMLNSNAEEWCHRLNQLPTYATYINKDNITIYLTHAGFTPKNITPELISSYELIWDRNHITDITAEDPTGPISVHGHTPIQYICEDLNIPLDYGALWYNNHKVCIDNGSYVSGIACLLDLDTFDEHIFSI